MSGEAAATGGAGAPAGGAAAPAPAAQPQRAKISDMSRMLEGGAPTADGIRAFQQGANVEPGLPQRQQGAPVMDLDDGHVGPDLGLGWEEQGSELARTDVDAKGHELEVDDSIPGELMDASEYEPIRAQFEAYQKHMASDTLPPEFDDKWMDADVKTLDGRPLRQRITVKECRYGYMRAVDYSNGKQELANERAELNGVRNGLQMFINDISDPRTFLQAIRNLGKWEVFEAAIEPYAQERWQEELLKKQNPLGWQQLQARRQAEQRALAAELRARQLEQQVTQARQQQPQQLDAEAAQIAHQLQQMLPIAQKRVGLEYSEFAEQIFEGHWRNMISGLEGPLTTDFVTSVMQATRDTVERYVALKGPQPPAAQPGLPPPSQQLPGRAPANGQNGRMPARAKIGDMGRMLRDR